MKTLEEYGIGRPSTYASIIQTLLSREYVIAGFAPLQPHRRRPRGSKFLSAHFTRYVDYDFTAKLEDELDAVSRGEEEWMPLMQKFWKPFKTAGRRQDRNGRSRGSLRRARTRQDPKTGKPVSVRLGRYGAYAQIGDKDDGRKTALRIAAARPEHAHDRAGRRDRAVQAAARSSGKDDNGEEVSAGIGRFGPFVKQGQAVRLAQGRGRSLHDRHCERAQELIRERLDLLANRVITDFGDGIQVLNGRYGAYITDGEKNARIPKDREPKRLTRECKALLAAAPVRRGRGAKEDRDEEGRREENFRSCRRSRRREEKGAAQIGKESAAAKKTATKKTAAKKTSAKKTPARRPQRPTTLRRQFDA